MKNESTSTNSNELWSLIEDNQSQLFAQKNVGFTRLFMHIFVTLSIIT